MRKIGLIGAPSSAGAHWPGQEKAPEYLRALGLVEQLKAKGCVVNDWGDLPLLRMKPDPQQPHPQNVAEVSEITRLLAEKVQRVIEAGDLPLIIGGDCSLEIGVVAGFLAAKVDPALLYFDGGLDLRTPADNPAGILDSMGVAHLLGEPEANRELATIGPRYPMLSDEQILYFGYEVDEEPEIKSFARHSIAGFTSSQVKGQAIEVAHEAVKKLEKMADRFIIHFDVDVMDFTDFPVADVPKHNSGLTFGEAMESLEVFVASPAFAGLTITEFNPDHADEQGKYGGLFVGAITDILGRHS